MTSSHRPSCLCAIATCRASRETAVGGLRSISKAWSVRRIPRVFGSVRRPPRLGAGDPTPGSRRRWSYVHPLDKRTAVGVARGVDLQHAYRSPTCVPISNVRTQLSRLWVGARPGRRRWTRLPARAGVGVTFTRWTNAQPLELHGAWISNVGPDLQRTYPTLTAVGRCTPTVDREPRGRAVHPRP